MAAISNLVLSETVAPNDRVEELDTPTTPRAGRYPPTLVDDSKIAITDREALPQPYNSSQPSNQGAELDVSSNRQDPEQEGGNYDQIEHDSMDLDEDDNDQPGSDNEAEQGETDPASRKKKGQRFFCTGYPPCNLSFTRSEHLARHIRKHTGERPFQCHCNRRFSRLDNLRQHAQTVHVNEEIPTDSLAATGTRFQRQIRTDRVRPTGRPRTGTTGSTGGHSRGHSRNLSASSVGSTSSNYSVVTEAKRRPPPLLMATDSATRSSLGVEPPHTPPTQYRGYGPNSPSGMSTPTSANFSATPGSPSFMSSLGSPVSSTSRSGGLFGSRPAVRRLSVPSGSNPYQIQYPPGYSMSYVSQMGPPSSYGSSNSSLFASPTSSTFPTAPGDQVPPGEDWRRRTWHPSTLSANFNYGRPATSGLTYSQTPDAPQPAHAQYATAAASQAPRLPGIESFDHVQHRSYTPPRRQPSPMQGTEISGDAQFPSSPSQGPRVRPGHVSWDGLRPNQFSDAEHQGEGSQGAASWSQQTMNEIQNVEGQRFGPHRHVDMGPPPSMPLQPQQHMPREALEVQSSLRQSKRQGWYNGPFPPARTSPEDSSSSDGVPTPGMTAVEVHPMIMHSNGYMEPHHATLPSDGHQNVCLAPSPYIETTRHQNSAAFGGRSGGEMNRLEALVAVATREENSAR